MATLAEMLAAKKAAGKGVPAPGMAAVDLPAPPPAAPAPNPPNHPTYGAAPDRPLGSQDKFDPLPMVWPVDEAGYCKGNELCVVIDAHGEGYLAIIRPGKPVIYLMGPLRSLNIPF